jgi:uncharacterized membrane protein
LLAILGAVASLCLVEIALCAKRWRARKCRTVLRMRTNDLLLTLHILATATWIGAALALQVIAARMRPSTPDEVVDHFAIDAETIGKMLFAPASVVLLVTGVALVANEHLGWTDAWILIGIGAFLVALAVGAVFLIPEGRRIAELARTPGHDPAEVRNRTRRRLLVARVDLLVLILAVADMVYRPGG